MPAVRRRITVTVERPGGTDRYGISLPGTSHTIDNCLVVPRGSEERTDGQATVITGQSLYTTSPGGDLASQDLVVLNGDPQDGDERWQVEGDPGAWGFGLEAVLTRAEG